MPLRALFPARTAACALALAVALATLPPAPASASPKPRKPTRTAQSKPSKSRSSTTRRPKPFERRVTQPTLPVLPSLMQLPSAELVLTGRATPEDQFAAMPVAAAPVAAPDGRPLSRFGASAERMLSAMVDRARSQLGTRYVFGGNEPGEGLDCSSFARFAMEALGIKLPRTAAQQAKLGAAVPRDRAALKPGDLLTFGSRRKVSHVGIYLGEGRFIHASVTSGRIIETTIERNARLFRRWQGARRLMADGDTTAARSDG